MKKILIVDDSSVYRMILKRIMTMVFDFDYEADEAVNGKEALLKIKAKKYDLVITDIHMPEMDGNELIQKINEEGFIRSGMKLFVITSELNKEKLIFWEKQGVSGFIRKPVKPEQFQEIMAQIGWI